MFIYLFNMQFLCKILFQIKILFPSYTEYPYVAVTHKICLGDNNVREPCPNFSKFKV